MSHIPDCIMYDQSFLIPCHKLSNKVSPLGFLSLQELQFNSHILARHKSNPTRNVMQHLFVNKLRGNVKKKHSKLNNSKISESLFSKMLLSISVYICIEES